MCFPLEKLRNRIKEIGGMSIMNLINTPLPKEKKMFYSNKEGKWVNQSPVKTAGAIRKALLGKTPFLRRPAHRETYRGIGE